MTGVQTCALPIYREVGEAKAEDYNKGGDTDRYKNISTLKVEFEHTINQKKYSLPFELESSGTKRYYGFAGLLTMLINEPSIVSIDELESSLHPDLYEHFLISYLMNSKQSQVIASTHYRDILNNKSIFRNDAIWLSHSLD